jgi:hypothetical protein
MLNSALRPPGDGEPDHDEPGHDEVEAVVRRGPAGALAVAGIATAIVLGIWVAFYLLVFVPRSGQP